MFLVYHYRIKAKRREFGILILFEFPYSRRGALNV